MPRRFVLTVAIMSGLALSSLHAQDKEKKESINDKVLRQVEKALKKFEGDLEKGKIESILKNVEQALDGKVNRFQWKVESPEGVLSADDLPKHLKILKGKIGDADVDLSHLLPDMIDLTDVRISQDSDRKVVGVMLGSSDDKVIVEKVITKSPAEKAGVKSGDIIIKVDGKTIKNTQGLIEAVEESDKDLKFSLKRDGKVIQIKVTPETASKVPGFNRSIIRLSKDGNSVELDDVEDVIELDVKDRKELHKKLIEGAKGNIFKFAPGKKGEKVEFRIERKTDGAKSKNVKRDSDAREIVEEEIDVVKEKSDTAKSIERLQKQLERLEKEITKLKKDK